ncbi:MAG: archaetidylserine decarboxylase [Gemmatimonadetes bacterium]|nr:archaetidylserine decarboxylase [Gemmatimonadota bacterium]
MSVPDVSPELPPRAWRLILALLGRLPQGSLSRAFGSVADVPLPRPLRRPVLGAFARAVGIDVSEAELGFEDYPTLNAFFVRRLRSGVRSWPVADGALGSPVDGIVGQLGPVEQGRVLQAKGRWYSAAELLADPAAASAYDGGSFITLYLSPRHYHRIHAPCGGTIGQAEHIPGALLPVNEAAVSHVANLFSRNERLVAYLDGVHGRVAVVAVGAYNVGRISAAFDPEWTGGLPGEGPSATTQARSVTNRRGVAGTVHRYDPPVRVALGDEIMAFHLGSTVVLLLEPGAGALRPDLRPGAPIRLGEPLTSLRRP